MHELIPWLQLIFRRPGRLVLGGVLIFLTLLSGMGLLALSGWFITETALVGLALAAGLQAGINLYVPGGGIRFFAVARTVTRYLERVYNHDTVLRLLTDIRVDLFQKLSKAGRVTRGTRTGAEWLSRLTSDVDALDTLYLRLIAPASLAALVTVLVVGLTAILFDGATAIGLGIILAIALLVATIGVHLRTFAIARQQSDRQEQLRTAVVEHLEGFAELTAAGRKSTHAAQLMSQAQRYTSEQARVDGRVGWHQAATHLLVNLAAVFALWSGISLFEKGIVSGPVLVLLPIALLGLGEVYGMLPDAFGKLGATQASAGRLNHDGQVSESAFDAPSQEKLPADLSVMVKDLGMEYDDHAPLFTHFDLQVKQGERLGIIGRSGSGKSSLADVLAKLVMPTQGTVVTEGFSYLTQRTVIFEDTLRANLLLGSPRASDAELWRVLELVSMADRFASEADQLDTWLGSAGSRLSGGEGRRIALARVLLNDALLLILDEPFTGVDAKTRAVISRRLNQWFEGKTVICLAHGPDALPDISRVIQL